MPRIEHNHLTRDFKSKGECPACDHSMAITAAKRVIENFLYEQNVDQEETEEEAKKLLKGLQAVGLTVSWEK